LQINYEQIETLFCAKMPTEKKKPELDNRAKTVDLVDPKRRQNVLIFLNTFKRDNNELRDAVLSVNEPFFTPIESLQRMLESIPLVCLMH
jgi:hypothetical protein